MTAKVPIRDSGTDRLGIKVARRSRRNMKITSTTSSTARIISNCTSLMEARMVVVRSVRGVTSTPAGSVAFSPGSIALISSTTSTTLAPG